MQLPINENDKYRPLPFRWNSDHGPGRGVCLLQFKKFDRIEKVVVCCTEMADNPGISITNDHASLRCDLEYLFQPYQIIFWERYTAESYPKGMYADYDENITLVQIENGLPVWTPIPLQLYREMFQ